MRVVMPVALPDVMAFRKRLGADQWDEMWEGVLHMVPAPHSDHQDFEGEYATYLRLYWGWPRGAKVFQNINLAPPGGWPTNYRVPDIVLLTPERFAINLGTHFEGAPDLAVEIHSPGDESYEKLAFYAELGVPEVWIIHRDTKEPEIYLLRRGRYRKQRPLASGWLRSPGTGLEMRVGAPGKLAVRQVGKDATCVELPRV